MLRSAKLTTRDLLEELLAQRLLLLDGAMGTLVQARGLEEADFRGKRFPQHQRSLKGCYDLLVLTQPEIIEEIHRAYLEAGADIISTDTFTATSISLADYGLESYAFEINRAAAEIAHRASDKMMRRQPERPRFVAGSIGPTNKTATLSPNVNDPGYRAVTFDELAKAYGEQVAGLMAGGVDLLLAETTFDTLNLKACLYAIEQYFAEHRRRVPVMASVTVTDKSGRTLSGQTVEAFWISVSPYDLFSVGINCASAPKKCALTWKICPASPPAMSVAIPTPACRTPSAASTIRPSTWRESSGSSPRTAG